MEDFFGVTPHPEDCDKKTPLKAIRAKCLDCCNEQPSEVRICHITHCSLWPFRMGKNPFHKRRMTNKQKQAATQHLRKEVVPGNETVV
jgi:hypothetical protein